MKANPIAAVPPREILGHWSLKVFGQATRTPVGFFFLNEPPIGTVPIPAEHL